MLGIYDDNNKLIKTINLEGKMSESLPVAIKELLNKYEFSEFAYANGPGSYMALKIAYVFLSTISLIKNIPLKAISGFAFSKNKLIKANNNLFFTLENEKIKLIKCENYESDFFLPDKYDFKFCEDNLPNYFLPAI